MERRYRIKISGPPGTRDVEVVGGKGFPVLKLCALLTLEVWRWRFKRWSWGLKWTD